LRERREDLGLLLASLLRRLAGDAANDVTFTPAAARALLLHLWPLNVRELEKCLASALVFARDRRVDLDHLPAEVRTRRNDTPAPLGRSSPPDRLDEPAHGHAELITLLREHGGNVTAVARALGKRRTQVQRWLRRLQIDALSFRR
jgi:DNA-binding NtrC family response regulator